jgi:hypothetical protein
MAAACGPYPPGYLPRTRPGGLGGRSRPDLPKAPILLLATALPEGFSPDERLQQADPAGEIAVRENSFPAWFWWTNMGQPGGTDRRSASAANVANWPWPKLAQLAKHSVETRIKRPFLRSSENPRQTAIEWPTWPRWAVGGGPAIDARPSWLTRRATTSPKGGV